MKQPKNNLTIPHRRKIIIWLFVGLGIFWGVMLLSGGNFKCSSSQTTPPKNNNLLNQVLPYNPAKSEIIRQPDGSYIIKWTGEGEGGFRLPDLAPGLYSLTWLRGKIVYSANGHSFPLWGADAYRKNNLRYFHLKDKGIRPHQVILVKGKIGSGEEELIPFRPGETQICFRSDARPLFLFYHFTRGEYDQFGWDGSYAVFRLEKLD